MNVSAPQSGDPDAARLAAGLTVQHFPHSSLAATPSQRFQELFTLRPQWVLEELQPFIAGLATDGKKAAYDALLLKHGRSVRAKWTKVHREVLLDGVLDGGSASKRRTPDDCILYQARVKYS